MIEEMKGEGKKEELSERICILKDKGVNSRVPDNTVLGMRIQLPERVKQETVLKLLGFIYLKFIHICMYILSVMAQTMYFYLFNS